MSLTHECIEKGQLTITEYEPIPDHNYETPVHVEEQHWISPYKIAEETLRELEGDEYVEWLLRNGCFNEAEGYETCNPYRTEDNCYFCGEHDADYFNVSRAKTVPEMRRTCQDCRHKKFDREFVVDTYGDERAESFGSTWIQTEHYRIKVEHEDWGWKPEVTVLRTTKQLNPNWKTICL